MRFLSTLKIKKKKLSLLTIFSFFALINAPPTYADNSKSSTSGYQLVDLSKDLSTIVRILNGIALSQGLNDGSVDAKEVVRELLNLKPGVTLDNLEKDNVVGLADDLAGLSTAVENECGGDKAPCVGNLKAITLGLTALERIPQLPSDDFKSLFVEDSSLNVMAKVKNSYDDVVKAKANVQNLIDAIGNMTSSAKINQLNVVIMFKQSVENLQSTTTFSNRFSQSQVDALDQNKLKNAIATLTKLGAISSNFDKERTTASELHEKLEKLEKVASSLKSFLSSENIALNEKKIAFLIEIKGGNKLLQTEKTLTNGFFEGSRDFDQLSLDLKTPFVKDILTNGTGTESLQKTFSPLFSMGKNLEPLFKIQETSKLTDFMENSQKLKDDLDAARLEIESVAALISFTDCSDKLNKLASEVRIKDWLEEEKEVMNAGNAPKTFSEKFNGIQFIGSDFATLQSLINPSNLDKTINDVKNHQDIDAIKTNINTLKTNLDAIDPSSLDWATKTKIAELIPSTNKWFTENKLDSISQCLSDKKSISKAKTEIGKRESLTAVLNLKPDNKYITEVSNVATSQKATITAWNEFKKAQKTRTTRAVESDKKLKDALKLTRVLSAAVKVFRDLSAFHTSEKDFDELMKAEKVIDDTINKLKNDKTKGEITKIWNDDTKYTLNSLKPLVDSVNRMIKGKPKKLSDLSIYFNKTLNFDKMVNLEIRRLVTSFERIKVPSPDLYTLHRLKQHNDMQWANGYQAFYGAYDSFLLVIAFFYSWSKGFPHENELVASTQIVSTGGGFSYIWIIVLSSIGLLALVSLGSILYCWIKSKFYPKSKTPLNLPGKLKRWVDRCILKKKKPVEPKPAPPSSSHLPSNSPKPPNPLLASTVPASTAPSSQAPLNNQSHAPPTNNQNITASSGGDDMKEKFKFYIKNKKLHIEAMDASEDLEDKTLFDENADKNPEPELLKRKLDPTEASKKVLVQNLRRKQKKIRNKWRAPAKQHKFLTHHQPSREELEEVGKTVFDNKLPDKELVGKMKFKLPKHDYYVNGDDGPYEDSNENDESEQLKTEYDEKTAEEIKIEEMPTENEIDKLEKEIHDQTKELQKVTPSLDNSVTRSSASGENVTESPSNKCQLSENAADEQEEEDVEIENEREEKKSSFEKKLKILNKQIKERREKPAKLMNEVLWRGFKNQSLSVKSLMIISFLLSFLSNENRVILQKFNGDVKRSNSKKDEELARLEGGSDFEMDEETRKYFKYPIINADKTINFVNLIHGMMSKEYLRKRRTEKGGIPIPFWMFRELTVQTTKLMEKEDPIIELNRKKTLVVGDIHGSYLDLNRALNLGILDKELTFLFLGDYVDRGERSIETLILLMALKNLNPEKFKFLRGNHELEYINRQYGFHEECLETLGHKNGSNFHFAANDMFREMPLGCILNNRSWCAHGGISQYMTSREELFKLARKDFGNSFEEFRMQYDILWSDPREIYAMSSLLEDKFPIGLRGGPVFDFTAAGVDMVMSGCKFDCIFRAHQVVHSGFKPDFGQKCVTLYGSTNNKNFNAAGCALVHDNGLVELIRIKNTKLDPGQEKFDNDKDKKKKGSKVTKPKRSSRSKDSKSSSHGTGGETEALLKRTKRSSDLKQKKQQRRSRNKSQSKEEDSQNNAVLLEN